MQFGTFLALARPLFAKAAQGALKTYLPIHTYECFRFQLDSFFHALYRFLIFLILQWCCSAQWESHKVGNEIYYHFEISSLWVFPHCTKISPFIIKYGCFCMSCPRYFPFVILFPLLSCMFVSLFWCFSQVRRSTWGVVCFRKSGANPRTPEGPTERINFHESWWEDKVRRVHISHHQHIKGVFDEH